MKKILFYLLAAVLVVAGCTKDDNQENYGEEGISNFIQDEFYSQKENLEYEVISEKLLSPEEVLEEAFGSRNDLDTNELRIKETFLKRCNEKLEEQMRKDPVNAPAIHFKKISFKYNTIDENGASIKLSAFMGWAMHQIKFMGFRVWWPYDQDHVLFCCPYTHTKEDECATKSFGGGGWEFLTMWHDNLFIMPDGQGFGENHDHTQTYLNHKLHARQYFDALTVGKKLYLDKYGKLEKDWTLRVAGASQGAGDGIALHKYLDTEQYQINLKKSYSNEKTRNAANITCRLYGYPEGSPYVEIPLRDIHRFEYSYVCCGPYSPETTMQTYSRWEKMSYPCVIPLVIKSMLLCYSDFLCGQKGYVEQDFFSEEWNRSKAIFDDLYLKKTMNSDDLNIYICKQLGITSGAPMAPLESILSKEMLDTDSQIYKDLITCLKKQELTSAWTPRTKIKLRYSENDEVVPVENTKKLVTFLNDNNCTVKLVEDSWKTSKYESTPVGHVDCCENYMKSSWEW